MSDKFVDFNVYCSKCKYANCEEWDKPCDDCLEYPVNDDSHKPVRFTPKSQE